MRTRKGAGNTLGEELKRNVCYKNKIGNTIGIHQQLCCTYTIEVLILAYQDELPAVHSMKGINTARRGQTHSLYFVAFTLGYLLV